MLTRLQKKTLIPAQLAGYTLTLLVGVAIVLLSVQLYSDIKPMLTQQTSVFKNHAVTVSKTVGMMNAFNKESIYFTDEEINELKSQPFVNDVAKFSSSSFHTQASVSVARQTFMTELFFESIPDRYIDVNSQQWKWDPKSNFIPVIIPEDYLNLYNFGFAESQSLPVVSQGLLEKVNFNISIEGNGKYHDYKGRIVGLSGKINTILAPEDFLEWANKEYGGTKVNKSSRLLVEFSDATDSRIAEFMRDKGYDIKQSELESSKIAFFFRLAMVFLLAVALIIIVLSMAFIIMSLNVIIQKNKDLMINLYNIGYSSKQIAHFYQLIVSIITLADMALAVVVSIIIRNYCLMRLESIFEKIDSGLTPIIIAALVLTAVLIVVYNIIILRSIKATVEPKGNNKH